MTLKYYLKSIETSDIVYFNTLSSAIREFYNQYRCSSGSIPWRLVIKDKQQEYYYSEIDIPSLIKTFSNCNYGELNGSLFSN